MTTWYNITNSAPWTLDPPVFYLLQSELNSPFPSGLVRGRQMMARARAKRLAARDAFDLVWSRKENSSLLITFILVFIASFSFRLRVICKRRVAEPSENSWLISHTAALTSAFIMGESCSSMSINIFYSAVDKTPKSNTRQPNLSWFAKNYNAATHNIGYRVSPIVLPPTCTWPITTLYTTGLETGHTSCVSHFRSPYILTFPPCCIQRILQWKDASTLQ